MSSEGNGEVVVVSEKILTFGRNKKSLALLALVLVSTSLLTSKKYPPSTLRYIHGLAHSTEIISR